MMCKHPYVHPSGNAFGCGQCLPCRINRRRVWQHRLILESLKHPASCFVTLTYNDEHLPDGGSLSPHDLQKFLKRLRRVIEPLKIRFYGVGEYGDRTWRPHYHLAIFGIGIDFVHVIADAWSVDGVPIGHVVVGSLTFESAGYIAGYVTKKLTNGKDEKVCEVLDGRYPEFARMSNRPGIGSGVIDEVADVLMSDVGSKELLRLGDVPQVLQHGGKAMPLGRYLRGKLREALDMPSLGFDSPAAIAQREELRSLLEGKKVDPFVAKHCKSALIAEAFKPKVRSIEVKFKIFSKEKQL